MNYSPSHETKEKPFPDAILDIFLEKAPNWIKWCLVLPLSIFSFGAVYSVLTWIIKGCFKELFRWNTISAVKIAQMIPALLGAIIYIRSSYSIAPKFKRQTALITLVLMILIMCSQISEEIHVLSIIPDHTYLDLIGYVFILTGAIIGYLTLSVN